MKSTHMGAFHLLSPRAGPVDLRVGIEARLSIFYERSEIKYPTVGTDPVRVDKRIRGPTVDNQSGLYGSV